MIRRVPDDTLGLWMNGAFVGTWTHKQGASDTLQYDSAWVDSQQGRPLSLSLPFTAGNAPHQGAKVSAYFENLLPDSKAIRERIARRFNIGSTEAFELLAEIGRDCVGALEILPAREVSSGIAPVSAEPLVEAQVAQLLRDATTPNALGLASDVYDLRISIAGAQEKTALLLHDGQWCLPRGRTPTSHIFKLPMGLIGGMKLDMRHSVENEWLCSLILKAFGLPVANCQPMQFEDIKVLVVERFDRTEWRSPSGERHVIRLPQEDFCQATGTPPDAKYEADGGPGMARIFDALEGSITREHDRRAFFEAQLLFWMLCATDGHAKNFSLFLRPGGAFQLTPLYDLLSAYPVLGEGPSKISPFRAKMAMAVRSKNPHWKMREILPRHWVELGRRAGVLTEDGREARFLLDQIVARTPEVIDAVAKELPDGFPEPVADSILEGVRDAAKKLAENTVIQAMA